MYLKSIEISGFKSFANKIILKFGKGITGIVGPNGSGKSNIADAMRWVLGEQSAKQLRGASMQDVIFSGTELRKPLSSAYVAITFDNSDHRLNVEFSEVTVARRVYRSGESEYLLNGSVVRLKMIQEMLYDTGIGKEGYSIIGQGQIEKIISGRADDRRELFDEATGIVKFKRRKGEAEKSLEEQKANLERVDDIISELEKQIGPLERQSDTAKKYLDLKEKLKKHDMNFFLSEEKRVVEQQKVISEKIAINSAELEAARSELERSKDDYAKAGQDITDTEAKIEEKRSEREEKYGAAERAASDISVCETKINGVNSNTIHFKDRLNSINDSLKIKDSQKEAKKKSSEALKKELEEKIGNKETLQKELEGLSSDLSEKLTELENADKKLLEEMNRVSEIKQNSAALKAEREQINIRKSSISSELITGKSAADELEIKYKEDSENLKNIRENLAKKREEVKEHAGDAVKFKEKLINDERELNAKKNELSKVKTKLDYTMNMAERYDGYGSAVKRVMQEKARLSGIFGVVADLISSEKKYETAIETALGGSMQNVVTDNEKTAQSLIEILKREKAGRATFLPLTAISPQGIQERDALDEPGAIDTADNLVKADGRFIVLVRHLLGRILVVENMDYGLAISKKYHRKLRIVTLEGDQINPGGSMSGGTYKNSSNLLSRKRELAELGEEVAKLTKQVDELKLICERDREKSEQADLKQKTLSDEISALTIKENALNISASNENSELTKLKNAYEANIAELKEIEGKLVEIDKSIEENEKLRGALEGNDSAGSEEKNRLSAKIEEIRELTAKKKDTLSDISARINVIESDKKHDDEDIVRIEDESRDLLKEKEEIEGDIAENESVIKTENDNIVRLKQVQKQSLEAAKKVEEKIADLQAWKEKLNASNKELFENHEKLNARITGLDKESVRLDNQKEKLDENFDSLTEYIWNEYEATPSDAEGYKDDEMMGNPNANKKEISQIKSQIKDLGDVNVNAIEQYIEVKERFDFLTNQHDDIIAARDKLIELIEELVEKMKQQFAEQFAEIRKQSDIAFKALFGGGTCKLELADSDDLLESDIMISATPPGKKLTNIMQLSGGEKALTAIALLFAILHLKPSPFCLLDEIDAALDDSNVSRFAEYLHNFTNSTQFIVITHRRGTMNAADALYGITMQEKGVSALVSVSLIDDKIDEKAMKKA